MKHQHIEHRDKASTYRTSR